MHLAFKSHVARMLLPLFLVAVSATASIAGGATARNPAGPNEIAVNIDNFTFGPQRLVVRAGTSVTWTNRDDIPHTVVASGKEFRSKVLDTGDTFSFTFTAPGTYAYFCSLHPHMTGTIVVEAATGSLPST